MPSQQKPQFGLADLKDAVPMTDPSPSAAAQPSVPRGFGAVTQQGSAPVATATPPAAAPARTSSKMVTKRDGTRAPFNADQINKSIERATYGLNNPLEKVMQIASETELTIYDGITTEEMDQATINAALVPSGGSFDTYSLLIQYFRPKSSRPSSRV